MAAIDFTTVEVWTKHGLVTYYLLFVMEPKTRRDLAGITTKPNETWLLGMARELTNHEDGFLLGKRYLIMDQDAKFSKAFRQTFNDEGVKPMQTSPYACNMNAPPRTIWKTARSLLENFS